MENKTLIYIGIFLLVLLLVGGLFASFWNMNGDAVKKTSVAELNKYRSEEIPEACRLPPYENDVEYWKQHLSHHQNTWYCLDYYGTSIEKIRGDK